MANLTPQMTANTHTPDPRYAQFGNYLRELRESANMSLRTLARRLNISAPFLSHVERGIEGPLGPEYWPKLERAFRHAGIDRDKLFRFFLQGKLRPGRRVAIRAFFDALQAAGGSKEQFESLKAAMAQAKKGKHC